MMLLDLMVSYSDLMQTEPQLAIAAPIIAAIIGAGASIYGANKAGKNSADANAAAKSTMDEQLRRNEQWWQQKQNENALNTPEAQAALSKAREMAAEQMAAARGTQAVMGGTDASIAATQQSVNKMLGETIGGIASASTARKDAAEQTYINRNNELSRQLIDYYSGRAAQNAQAGSGALQSLGGIASSLISSMGN
jgi:uncharacterized protein YpmB